MRAAVPCWRGCTQNPKLISHQFLPLHLRSHCRLHLAVLARTTNGDFELKGFVVHFQSLNSIIPWCVLFNAQTACDMTEPEAFPSIMSSLHTLAALVSTQWQCTGRALNPPSNQCHSAFRMCQSAPGLALQHVLMHLQSTLSCVLCFN